MKIIEGEDGEHFGLVLTKYELLLLAYGYVFWREGGEQTIFDAVREAGYKFETHTIHMAKELGVLLEEFKK